MAIVLDEPLAARCLQTLLESPPNRMSAASFLEAAIVVDRLPDPRDSAAFDDLIVRLDISIEPVTAHQASIARDAYRRFGRGSGHPARLNFGVCFAYPGLFTEAAVGGQGVPERLAGVAGGQA